MVFYLALGAWAQPSFEDDFVVEIDTAQSKNVGKSLTLALGLSALVPGSGEFYLEEKKASKIFFLTEVGMWGALWFSYLARESYLQSARNYAREYAGLKKTDADADFLSVLTKYRSYQEIHHCKCSYEHDQILSGKRDGDYDIPATEENYWNFGSAAVPENTENWKTFIHTTKAYGRAKVAVTWAVGGLLLGRLASLINTLHVYRTTSVKGLAEGNNNLSNEGDSLIANDNNSKNQSPRSSWSLAPMYLEDGLGALAVFKF